MSVTAGAFDVVVLGAGPAGLATAMALRRRAPLSVLVVDAGPPGRERVGETTSPNLLGALSRLGLTERFRHGGHVPCPGTASIWGRERVGYNDFVLDPMGPAWRLDRPQFDRMLVEAAEESGVTLWWRTRFDCVAPDDTAPRPHHLRLSSAAAGALVVRAGCVVDATGPGAHLARAMGARRRVDDRLFAAVRFGRGANRSSTLQTLIEAVAEGWWYGARTPDDRAVVMFVTDREGIRRLWAGGPGGFDAALARTSLVRSVASSSMSELRPVVLAVLSSALDRYAGDGWVAVGDAAASYDPIAGQGVSKALADGIAAAGHVLSLLEGSPPLVAPPSSLAEYRRDRAHFYGLERRFPSAAFWEARRARATQAVSPVALAPVTADG